jgi:lipopolysaccharide biosynthesis regulator YciM
MAHLFSIKNDMQAEALKERDNLLREHPELREFQRIIDDRLRRAGSAHNRLAVIYEMMMDSFRELNARLQEAAAMLR